MAIENVLEAYGNNLVGAHIDNSSGSDGHTIKDGDGTAMTPQPNLQFADANVSNDSTNNATVVHNFVDINWDDWQEVDDNDDTYYRVTDAPLVDGNVEVDLMKKLWENPAPTASFTGQTITLSSDDYDFLMVLYLNNGGIHSNTVDKGQTINLTGMATRGGTNTTIYERAVNYVTDTQLAVGGGLSQTNGSTRVTDNSICVPQTIYGIKQKITISLSAIIANVSTSASKCMLSDGETSVEDAFNYSTDEHVVGKWIDGSVIYEKTVDCGALPNNTTKSIAHNISNINRVISINGIGIGNSFLPLPWISSTNQSTIYASKTNIIIVDNDNLSSYHGYVTLRYTKTS